LQDILTVIDYRAKLKGAEAAAGQVEKLTSSLAAAQESPRQAKTTPVSIDRQSRDPRRLYDGNNPIALLQDPKIDLEKKKFPCPVSAGQLNVLDTRLSLG
jgi:hypothetical protein